MQICLPLNVRAYTAGFAHCCAQFSARSAESVEYELCESTYTMIYIDVFGRAFGGVGAQSPGNKFMHIVSAGISWRHRCHDFPEVTWLRLRHNWPKCAHCARVTCVSPTGVSSTLLCLAIYVRRIAKHRRPVACTEAPVPSCTVFVRFLLIFRNAFISN